MFPTANKLDNIFSTLEVRTRKGFTDNISYKYFSERGDKNKIPHYQGLLVTDVGVNKSDVVVALSERIFNQKFCPQLNVSPCSEDRSITLHSYISKNPWIITNSEFAVGERSTIKDWNKINEH